MLNEYGLTCLSRYLVDSSEERRNPVIVTELANNLPAVAIGTSEVRCTGDAIELMQVIGDHSEVDESLAKGRLCIDRIVHPRQHQRPDSEARCQRSRIRSTAATHASSSFAWFACTTIRRQPSVRSMSTNSSVTRSGITIGNRV